MLHILDVTKLEVRYNTVEDIIVLFKLDLL
jgi:hypothetical protein